MATKDSKEQDIQKATLNGGVIYVGGVRTYIDNPRNYDVVECASGFWIMNALGWKTYFKCPTREKAQNACDVLYGNGAYRVTSKI